LIGFDYAIVSAALLASYMQCVLAAAEETYCGMELYDPVGALRTWSWCLDLKSGRLPAQAALVDGRQLTLPQYIGELVGRLLVMCEQGLIADDVAPQAKELLPRIIDLACYLQEGSLQRCGKHLDWAAKLLCLLGTGVPLGAPSSRLADHDFASTDPERGTLWRLWERGLVDPLIQISDADACLIEPPVDSRAWARGTLLERFFHDVTDMAWERIELRQGTDRWSPRLEINLPRLDSLRKTALEPLLGQARDVADLKELLGRSYQGAAKQTTSVDYMPRYLVSGTAQE
jgi:proteasome accessory factor A